MSQPGYIPDKPERAQPQSVFDQSVDELPERYTHARRNKSLDVSESINAARVLLFFAFIVVLLAAIGAVVWGVLLFSGIDPSSLVPVGAVSASLLEGAHR